MARYVITIDSTLAPDAAYAYMADFSNARFWDPSVTEARREGDAFELVASFGGRPVPLRYEVVSQEPPRSVVLQAVKPTFVSRDTITIAPGAGAGSTVHYDARLDFKGVGRLLDPLLQLLFNRTGAKAADGLRAALNP